MFLLFLFVIGRNKLFYRRYAPFFAVYYFTQSSLHYLFGVGVYGVIARSPYLAPLVLLNNKNIKRTSKKLRRLCRRGEIPIPHLSVKEAADKFDFDKGHPIDGTSYILNPANNNHYIITSKINERYAREKQAVFKKIMATLGAKSVKLISGEIHSSKKSARKKLSVAAQDAGMTGIIIKEDKVQSETYMEFGEPDKLPYVPDELMHWCNVDPDLSTIVYSRLEAKLLKAGTSLTFTNTSGITVEACAKIKGLGIDVGGEAKEFHESSWKFDVEFWPYVNK